MSFEQNLAEKAAHCEKVLRDMLPSVEGLQGTDRYAAVVVDAMQYSVMAGGKRLRPLFIYETCRMYGGREELAAPFMAALEMIHNYSLVHDDMPAMDNDEYRRGRKTTWVVYGEGMAILAGLRDGSESLCSVPRPEGDRRRRQRDGAPRAQRGRLRNGGRTVRRPGGGEEARGDR